MNYVGIDHHRQCSHLTVGTADAGKPAAGVAAVEVALDHILDYGPEEAILLLEAALIVCQETVEVMKQHSVEDGPLRMPRTIHSHGGRRTPRNRPRLWK
jgi:hypothetical protein